MTDEEKQALVNRTQRVLNDPTRCFVCNTIKEGNTNVDGGCKVCLKRKILDRAMRYYDTR